MKLLSTLLGLQAAFSAASVINRPSDTVDVEVTSHDGHRFVKRVASSDANWCNGKIHESEGTFKPMSAVCNWALDRSYSVRCVQQNARNPKTYWIQGWCDVGTLCEQREEARLWNGQLGFDVDCVPSRQLVKWAIGARETGHKLDEYCSHNILYENKGGRTAVWEFFAQYFGTLGQNTQIHIATILWNGKSIQRQLDVNHVGTRHQIKPGDTIRYCGVRGSDSLIEGYATAKIVKYINDAGEEEDPEDEPEIIIKHDPLEASDKTETEADAQAALNLITEAWAEAEANGTAPAK